MGRAACSCRTPGGCSTARGTTARSSRSGRCSRTRSRARGTRPRTARTSRRSQDLAVPDRALPTCSACASRSTTIVLWRDSDRRDHVDEQPRPAQDLAALRPHVQAAQAGGPLPVAARRDVLADRRPPRPRTTSDRQLHATCSARRSRRAHDYESAARRVPPLPPSESLGRSFTLSLKAKPKKRSTRRPPPMDGGDRRRRGGGGGRTRCAAALHPEQMWTMKRIIRDRQGLGANLHACCCDEWTSEFGAQRPRPVVKVLLQAQAIRFLNAAAQRVVHWFSRVGVARRRRRAPREHLVHPRDQPVQGRAGPRAQARADDDAQVDRARGRPRERRARATSTSCASCTPRTCRTSTRSCAARRPASACSTSRRTTRCRSSSTRRGCPFLNQILYAGWLHGRGKYLTYSNIDIGVQATFYLKIGAPAPS